MTFWTSSALRAYLKRNINVLNLDQNLLSFFLCIFLHESIYLMLGGGHVYCNTMCGSWLSPSTLWVLWTVDYETW